MSLEYHVPDVGQWSNTLIAHTSNLFRYDFQRELNRAQEPACGFLLGYDAKRVILVNYSLMEGFNFAISATQYQRPARAEVTVFNLDEGIMKILRDTFPTGIKGEQAYYSVRVGGLSGIGLNNAQMPPKTRYITNIGDIAKWSESLNRFMESAGLNNEFLVELKRGKEEYTGYGLMCFFGASGIAFVNYSTNISLNIATDQTHVEAQAEMFFFNLGDAFIKMLSEMFNAKEPHAL